MSLKNALKMRARIGVKRFIKSNTALFSNLISTPESGPGKIIILMYHRINSYRNNELSVKEHEFRKQVGWLKENRYRNMRISELESLADTEKPESHRVIFTFDDGYEDNIINALPILKEYGYTGMFYIPFGFIGTNIITTRDQQETNDYEKNRRLSWKQIERLIAEGMDIGSHTLNHQKLTDLTPDMAWQEITESKKKLEEKLGVAITSFCYPGGRYDKTHIDMVARAGYKSACTASPGRFDSTNLFTLPRLAVQASDSFYIFRKKIEGKIAFLKMVR